MGPERVLQAAVAVAVGLAASQAPEAIAQPAKARERVAVIDLGPPDTTTPPIRQRLAAVLVAKGLEPVAGDGLEDALAGETTDRDALELASALAIAQDAYGKLDCPRTVESSSIAVGLAAQRQASGLPVPELPRALTYLLLCADRTGDLDAAMFAARLLRAAGGSGDVPADVWRKYPEIDTVVDHELVPVEITADVAGASIFVDGKAAGAAPVQVFLPVGEHVIAAAAGTRRGWARGKAVASQPKVTIPTADQGGTWAEVARRVASWGGKLPAPQELGWVLAKTRARIAIVRHGDTLEAYGRSGLAEAPYRLGGADGVGTLADAERLAALVADRAQTWADRAPDPDRPLLVDDATRDKDGQQLPTKWWVYASIAGAVAAGAILIYANDAGSDRQRVELVLP